MIEYKQQGNIATSFLYGCVNHMNNLFKDVYLQLHNTPDENMQGKLWNSWKCFWLKNTNLFDEVVNELQQKVISGVIYNSN